MLRKGRLIFGESIRRAHTATLTPYLVEIPVLGEEHVLVDIAFVVVAREHRLGEQRLVELRRQQQLVVVVGVQLVDEVVVLERRFVQAQIHVVVVADGPAAVAAVGTIHGRLRNGPDGGHLLLGRLRHRRTGGMVT